MGYHHKSGAQKRREKAMRAKGVKGQNTLKQHGFAGANTGFTKRGRGGGGGGGLRPAIRNAGGGGGCVCGAVRFRPDTKSRGCCPLKARDTKSVR